MTPNELVDKFVALETHIAGRRGEFALFALFLREDAPERWDLMIAAPWIGPDRDGAVKYFVDEIKSFLGPDYLTLLSRIVIIDPNETAVEKLNRAIHVDHNPAEVRDSNFFGLAIKQAFIITSKRPGAPVAG